MSATATTTTSSDDILDTSLLKEVSRRSLIDALNSINGAKNLVLDPSIAGPLGLVAEVSLFKDHGIDKMFWLEEGPLGASTTEIVYLCRPRVKWLKIIANQIKGHAQANPPLKHNYTLFLVPRVSTLATRILEEEGVFGEVTLSSYDLHFITLEEDVVSLEYETAFKEIWVDGDETAVYDSAQALYKLQKLYGAIPRIVSKGDKSARLCHLFQKIPPTGSTFTDSSSLNKIDGLIIIDRQIDMLTPLLTQLTYEGLIDEMMGIKNANVEVPASLLAPTDQNAPTQTSGVSAVPPAGIQRDTKEKKKKYFLSSATDPLITELRDLNFSQVGKKLSKLARRLDEDFKSRLKAKTVAQFKEFVGKLGGLQTEHQALKVHTGLAEILLPLTKTDIFNASLEIQQNLLSSYDVPAQLNAIEDLIAQEAPENLILRLLCLASMTSGGIKPKILESLKREVLQTYGYDRIAQLLNLASLSLLNPPPVSQKTAKFPFTQLRKQLRLVVEDQDYQSSATNVNVDEPWRAEDRDISYTYSGYAPLSCRLIQCVAQKEGVLAAPSVTKPSGREDIRTFAHSVLSWKGFEDTVGLLPGETVDITLQATEGQPSISRALVKNGSTSMTTIVFFLGGCTYTEIAALRWMSRQMRGRRFLIATTGIINGNTLMQAFQ